MSVNIADIDIFRKVAWLHVYMKQNSLVRFVISDRTIFIVKPYNCWHHHFSVPCFAFSQPCVEATASLTNIIEGISLTVGPFDLYIVNCFLSVVRFVLVFNIDQ